MDRHYSTLELVKHDETARALELDYDATAFELDTSAMAPQTVPDTTPEVFYEGSLPEAHGNEKPTEQHIPITKLALKWPWIVMALMIAAAIAVGVSVGIWHHREYSLHKLPRTSRCGLCTDRIYSWLAFIARWRRQVRKLHRILTSHTLLNTSLTIHL